MDVLTPRTRSGRRRVAPDAAGGHDSTPIGAAMKSRRRRTGASAGSTSGISAAINNTILAASQTENSPALNSRRALSSLPSSMHPHISSTGVISTPGRDSALDYRGSAYFGSVAAEAYMMETSPKSYIAWKDNVAAGRIERPAAATSAYSPESPSQLMACHSPSLRGAAPTAQDYPTTPDRSVGSAGRSRSARRRRRPTIDDDGDDVVKFGKQVAHWSLGYALAIMTFITLLIFQYPSMRPWRWNFRKAARHAQSQTSSPVGLQNEESPPTLPLAGVPQDIRSLVDESVRSLQDQWIHRISELEQFFESDRAASKQSQKDLKEVIAEETNQKFSDIEQRLDTHIHKLVSRQVEEMRASMPSHEDIPAKDSWTSLVAAEVSQKHQELVSEYNDKYNQLLSVVEEKLQKLSGDLEADKVERQRTPHSVPTQDASSIDLPDGEASAVPWIAQNVMDGLKTRPSHYTSDNRQTVINKENLLKAYESLWRDVHLGGTGVLNWALQSLGATIVDGFTTPGYNRRNVIERVLRYVIEHSSTGRWQGTTAPFSKPADIVLSPTTYPLPPGNCFTLGPHEGNITIQLSRAIIVSEVAIEHAMPELVVDTSTAPHNFEVWGWPAKDLYNSETVTDGSSQQSSHRTSDALQQSEGTAAAGTFNENPFLSILSTNELFGAPVLIGQNLSFDYPTYRLQVFKMRIPTVNGCWLDGYHSGVDQMGCGSPLAMRRLTYRFLSNHGGQWTSVYRLRVHGKPIAPESN